MSPDRNSIRSEGRTVDEAVREALLHLGARRDEVDITVIEEGKSGLFGVLGRKAACVEVVRKPRRGRSRDGQGRGRGRGRDEGERREARGGGRSDDRRERKRDDRPDRQESRDGEGRRRRPRREDRDGERRDARNAEAAPSDGERSRSRQGEGDEGAPRKRRRRRGGRGRGRGRGEGAQQDERAAARTADPTEERPAEARSGDDRPRDDRPRDDRPRRQPRPRRGDGPRREERPREEERPAPEFMTHDQTAYPEETHVDQPAPEKKQPARPAAKVVLGEPLEAMELAERIDAEGDVEERIVAATMDLMGRCGILCRVQVGAGDDGYRDVKVVTDADGADAMAGRRNSMINAVQHLVDRMVSKSEGEHVKVNVDINNYRNRRDGKLVQLAAAAMKRVQESGEDEHLPPMNARERRVVHMEVAEVEGLTTITEGEGPDRHVIIQKEQGDA